MQVKVKLLNENAKVPTYGTDGAAAFDIYSLFDESVLAGGLRTCNTGLAMEVPDGHVMLMFSRSGHVKNDLRLANCVGVIDSDYRGEIMVALRNDGSMVQRIRAGDRIAQGLIVPIERVDFVLYGELSPTARGEGGFGSTGR